MLKSGFGELGRVVKMLLLSVVLIAFLAGLIGAQPKLVGDLNRDYKVDFKDLRMFVLQWLNPDCHVLDCIADMDDANGVNMVDFALLAKDWKVEEPHLVISEFMASNASEEPLEEGELLDGNGESSDWLEIYNPTGETVSLDGWYLTDSNDDRDKWKFPDGNEIKSGEFLIIFASEKTEEDNPDNYPYRDPAGYYHTNFELNMDGEYLALVAPDGNTAIHEYAPEFPRQLTDISYGLTQYAKTLVPIGTTASYHVPTSSDATLGTDWTAVDFNDPGWETGKTGLGFGFGGTPRVAYNDCVYRSSDQYIGDNVTTYGVGGGYGGPTSGLLIDQATGEDMGLRVTLTQSGGVTWQPDPGNGGSDCAVGTDAYDTFGTIADMTGVIYYGSTGWWVDLTFTGLDPATEYTFATSAARCSYTGRWTNYTLTGADTYTNASTSGVDVLAESKVQFNTGDNYNEGYVARWTSITADDGSFTVRAEADPSSTDGRKAYSFDVFKLEGGFSGGDSQLKDDMLGINASLWMRTEFNLKLGEPELFDTLTLRMKYEDGFVAYINGQEVASCNAPDSVQWDSTADANRPIGDASVFEAINIMASAQALQAGKNVLAIHGLNDNADDTNFLILPELNAASNMSVPQYFTTATPRKPNISGAEGVVGDVWFSESRGFYEDPFQLTLSTGTDDAEIYYTLDGSRPTMMHGNPYTGPFDVNETTTLRAVAGKPGWLDSDVETHTYIFLDDVVTQSPYGEVPPGWPPSGINGQKMEYGMDTSIVNNLVWGPQLKGALVAIPTMSIVTDLFNLFDPSSGIYVNAGGHGEYWERPTSLELIYPPNPQGPGFPDLVKAPDGQGGVLSADMRGGFQVNAGLRIRGGASRSGGNPKHAFRLFFRSIYGDGKLNYPLFGDEGVDAFDKVDLRTAQNYSWSFNNDSTNTMCRDVWARDTQGLMGQASTRSRYYHLYINGQYWGIFQTQERPEAAYGASYFGGDREEWDCVKATGPNGGYGIEATDGTLDYWQDLWNLTNNLPGASDSQRLNLYLQMQGLNSNGTRNPSYPVLLDVDNLIDYMIMVFYDGDRDAPISNFLGNTRVNNWYCVRNQNGEEGFRHFVHDAEHIMSRGLMSRTGPFTCGDQFFYSNPQWIHQRLMLIPEYRLRFADHAHKHLFNGGLLTADAAIGRFQARAEQINMAIIAESARWGSATLNKDTWQSAINNEVGGFFPSRSGIIVNQLKITTLWDGGAVAPLYPSVVAPSFNQQGGSVSKNFNLTMSAPVGSSYIYYTINGSDPREPLTGNAVGTPYAGLITLSKSTHVKARVLYGGTWSALNEAIFAIGPVKDDLRITEIMYHPKNTDDPNAEFIELENIGPDTLNLNLVRFTEGINFTFPDMELEPNECVVV
ncbi:MAG TPA: hypothetical protein HPP66_13870, partial [Planctomycetes bacterium]|nr:hypothetical protein [Planctomycetota bacterium]